MKSSNPQAVINNAHECNRSVYPADAISQRAVHYAITGSTLIR
nr:hypothetical protein [Burkholderia anthina]